MIITDDFKDKGLVIRRFKKDIADQVKDEFKTRQIFTIKSNASIYEEEVFHFISNISFKTIDSNKRKGSELFKTTLIKSLLSSPIACIESIKNRIKKIENLEDDYSDDIDTLELLLKKLETVDVNSFSKYQELVNLVKNKMKWKKATDDRIVIFTERIKTLEFLKEHLQDDLNLKDEEIVSMTGSTMSDIEINKIVEDFGQENSKIRVLIATDVASEGINLHYLSHRLIHFDIPWSLMTFQQRNGRVDRYGQEKDPEIYYMQTLSNDEKFKGDNRILEILIKKDEQAALNIGDPSAFMNVYDEKAEEAIVAQAIENQKDAEEFSKELDVNASNAEFDFLSFLNELNEQESTQENDKKVEFASSVSLFENDLKYTTEALKFLQTSQKLEVRFEEDRIELLASELDDLKYRFKMLPNEVVPDKWHFILTNDLKIINQEIKNSRKNESAWPNINYLWEQHPLLEWLKDKLLSNFNTLEAPILTLNDLEQNELIYIVSGVIPNKKAQPVIDEWIGVRFIDDKFDSIMSFEEVLKTTNLNTKKLPNSAADFDTTYIKNNLPIAIEKAKEYISLKRDAYDDAIEYGDRRDFQRTQQGRVPTCPYGRTSTQPNNGENVRM
jgi:superfamily II DNA/RNA helicase